MQEKEQHRREVAANDDESEPLKPDATPPLESIESLDPERWYREIMSRPDVQAIMRRLTASEDDRR